jgi:hypothetical protein
MVARFWNAAVQNTLAAQVEWTDAFYSEDSDRLASGMGALEKGTSWRQ